MVQLEKLHDHNGKLFRVDENLFCPGALLIQIRIWLHLDLAIIKY